jgi:hypothetical protein
MGPGSAAQHHSASKDARVRAFGAALRPGHATRHPRPTNGILLAMTVMNSTLASSGRLAM